MRLFREYGADQQSLFCSAVKSQAFGNLTYTQAVLLLAVPEEEREQFAVEHNIEAMTSRELRKAIKERDEARRAAEQAQADSRVAEEERKSLMESIKGANALLDLAKEEKLQMADRIEDLKQQLAELKAAPVEVAIATVDQEKLDAARAEGEASKAEEITELQAKLDKAKAAKDKAEEKRKNAEAAVDILKLQLEEAAKSREKAAAMADPEVAEFKAYYGQADDLANKMHGILLKIRNREKPAAAENLARALLALGEKVRGYAQ